MDGPGLPNQYSNKELPSIPEFSSQHPPRSPPKDHSREWIAPWATEPSRPVSADFFDSRRFDGSNKRPSSWPVKLQVEETSRDGSEEDEKKEPSALLVISLFVSVFLSALDITIITTALPTIAEHMGTDATGFVWIGSAYLLAGAASEPVWAKVSDIFGRKPVLMIANAVFLAGSALCALSNGMVGLISGRVVQGLGSGGLLVLVNILIGDLFSPRKRGAYYGLLGLVWSIANGTGPFLGGLFATKMNWRWCFWVNVPIDGLALILTTAFLKVETPHTPFWEGIMAIDWLGSLAVVGGTILLLLGLEFGGVTFPWDSGPVVTLIVSGVAIWLIFFLIEAHVPKYPLIPLRLFNNISNICILAVDFSHGFVFIAGSYYLPVYFQAVLGANALLSGVYLFPFVLTLSFTAIGTGYIINKTGAYQPLITGGMLFLTLGFALFIDLPAHESWSRIVIYQLIAGIGVGPNFQSPMLALQNSVAPHDIGAATSTFGFVRQLANAISVVLGGVILQNQLKTHRSEMLDAGIEVRVVNLLTGGSAVSSVMEIDHLPKYPRQVARTAFAASLSKMWIMYACVGIVGLGLTDFIRRKELSDQHQETKTGLEEQERVRKHEEERRAARKAGRAMGVLPDVEDPEDQDRKGFDYGGKSAEVLGLTPTSRTPSMRSPMPSRSASSSKLNGGSSRSRDLDVERDRYLEAKGSSSMEFPLPPKSRKEGALNAARRRSNLRQISKKIAGGQHLVRPLAPELSHDMSEEIVHDTTSSHYPDDFFEDVSDDDSLELKKQNAKIEEELRAAQSQASRNERRSHISHWVKGASEHVRKDQDLKESA